MLNDRLLIVTESELVKQVFLAQSFLSINIASSPLGLLILLLVGDEKFFDLIIDHFLSLSLFLLTRLVV